MRMVLLGGSFNPVHVGHLILAEEVRSQFGYDVALLVPSFRPPHKELACDPGPAHRLAMLRLAAEGDPTLAVDACELERGGLSYTIDTLRDVIARWRPEGKPGLIIGDDLAEGFASWRDPELIAAAADIVLARRAGSEPVPFPYPRLRADNSLVQVSSSLVRERAASGRAFRRLVDPRVFDYILRNGLYGAG
jgi:nicotinate-nucleotide adenylyltransferase